MKAEIARHFWNSEHYYQIRMENDDQLLAAVKMMPEAKEIGALHAWTGYSEKRN